MDAPEAADVGCPPRDAAHPDEACPHLVAHVVVIVGIDLRLARIEPEDLDAVWSFGEPAYGIIRELLALRERMKPYLLKQMKAASEHGTPPMRPLFFDFPGDENAYQVEDQLLRGPDVLVAPVLELGQRKRRLYLPGSVDWDEVQTGRRHTGGMWVEVGAPLESVPVFFRAGRRPF